MGNRKKFLTFSAKEEKISINLGTKEMLSVYAQSLKIALSNNALV